MKNGKNNKNNALLRHDLAELYTKLKKFDEAEKVLKETLDERLIRGCSSSSSGSMT